MSAKNRSAAENGNPNEFYATEAWVVDVILPRLHFQKGDVIVDAGCGTGAIMSRLPRECRVIGVEIDKNLIDVAAAKCADLFAEAEGVPPRTFVHGDFLEWAKNEAPRRPDPVKHIIMNPPYSLAEEFVRASLKLVDRRFGSVSALLRLPWLASKCRYEFHREFPSDVHVLTKRPSFTGDGKSDATDYAWFTWSPKSGGKWSLLKPPVLPKRRRTVAEVQADARTAP